MDDINYVIDAFGTVDNLSLSALYKKHFYGRYEETTSLPISGSPYGMITTVQSDAYPVEVEAIKKIFFPTQQALPQGLATSSALTLQLTAVVEKEVVAKDGINKLKLFHICGMINPESTSFDNLSLAMFSKGMDLVGSQPRVGRAGALSDLLRQTMLPLGTRIPSTLGPQLLPSSTS
jgi:hypothetical protein